MSQRCEDYPWIVRWADLMGSRDHEVAEYLARARVEQAPPHAIFPHASGGWATTDDVTKSCTRAVLGLPPLEEGR